MGVPGPWGAPVFPGHENMFFSFLSEDLEVEKIQSWLFLSWTKNHLGPQRCEKNYFNKAIEISGSKSKGIQLGSLVQRSCTTSSSLFPPLFHPTKPEINPAIFLCEGAWSANRVSSWIPPLIVWEVRTSMLERLGCWMCSDDPSSFQEEKVGEITANPPFHHVGWLYSGD